MSIKSRSIGRLAAQLGSAGICVLMIVSLYPPLIQLISGTDRSFAAGNKFPVYGGHPRCVFRPQKDPGLGRTFRQARDLVQRDPVLQSIIQKALEVDPNGQHPAANAACWIASGEPRFASAAIEQLLHKPIDKSGEPYYSQVWSHALAYDWLFHYPTLDRAARQIIVDKILQRLRTELDELDRDYMALWHGRNQAANGAMIAALVMEGEEGAGGLLVRAQEHWLESMRALRYSEGWPEGASYWIYNRAGPYALTADCVLTATGRDRIEDIAIRDVMRKIGLWQLYQYGPNGRFEPYGDSAGSLHLGDTGWWVLSMDHFAKLSQDSAVAAGADYFRARSPDPYGKRKYYWNAIFTYEPSARPKDPKYDAEKPEVWMRRNLPQAMLFGRDSYGVAFFRGKWGDPDEVFATFKAGDLLAHHDHYDVGNFTIQRGGDLVPQTGFYGSYYEEHRLGYQVQTVSANSILVFSPGEFSNYLRGRSQWPWISGGQRVISPTGFDCVSLEHYRQQLNGGPHLERADITAWESVPKQYDYISADITAAYNSTRYAEPGNAEKVSLVTRQFLYLRREEVFVVHDRVHVTGSSLVSRYLLHSMSKPHSARERLLKGSRQNGILESHDQTLQIRDGRGVLKVVIVEPQNARLFKIGGPDFCFYVEADGDISDGFDGRNLTRGSGRGEEERKVDQWRIEVEGGNGTQQVGFLTVLIPRLAGQPDPKVEVESPDVSEAVRAVRIGETLVLFAKRPVAIERVQGEVTRVPTCLLLDAVPEGRYLVNGRQLQASSEGILRIQNREESDLDLRLIESPSAVFRRRNASPPAGEVFTMLEKTSSGYVD